MITWTQEITDRICELIESGKSINSFAGKKGLPSAPSIYRRMARDAEFAQCITLARAAQQEAEMERCIELADNATPETVHVVKLQIWARQWRASRMFPKKWGQHAAMDITTTSTPPMVHLSQEQSDTLTKYVEGIRANIRQQMDQKAAARLE